MTRPDDCLDGPNGCAGETFQRAALSGSGMYYPRCDTHYDAYVDRLGPVMEDTRRRYPDSATPPDWFDPTYAGESWDEDY